MTIVAIAPSEADHDGHVHASEELHRCEPVLSGDSACVDGSRIPRISARIARIRPASSIEALIHRWLQVVEPLVGPGIPCHQPP